MAPVPGDSPKTPAWHIDAVRGPSTPSFKTRFENEKGTNPEEMIAAAHAGCFTMALAFGLQGAGFTPTELSTEAAVTPQPAFNGAHILRNGTRNQ